MKLILAIVSSEDSSAVMKHLVKSKFFFTKLASSGGLLKRGNTTLMIGAKDEDVDDIVKLITEYSKSRKEIVPNSVISEFGMMSAAPIEVTVGGATLFIIDVKEFIKV